MRNGKFIISLDFELHWGGAEKWNLQKKEEYFLNTIAFIPELLAIFKKDNISASWATVGFLFAKNKTELKKYSPELLPSFTNQKLNYYKMFSNIGDNEISDPFHYSPSLIKRIISTPGQELASHTFSHYYCEEEGQTVEQFNADLQSAQAISKKEYGIELRSLVFPRNQFNRDYLEVALSNGIKIVRSNPNVWFWQKKKGKLAALYRALDTLMPISKSVSFSNIRKEQGVVLLPASRFFRPYSKLEQSIQFFKIHRIKNEMSYAAKHNKCYHLWWHPHNFGDNIEENKKQLLEILAHFKILKEKYKFESVNMLDFENIDNE